MFELLAPVFINYTIGSTLPEILSLHMDNNISWEVKMHPHFILKTSPFGISVVVNQNGWYIITGSVECSLVIKLATYWSTTNPQSTDYNIYIKRGNQRYLQPITINAIENIEWSFTPQSISFSGIKGIEEPIPQDVIVDSQYPFTVENLPSWLSCNPLLGIDHVVLTLVPVSTSITTAGVYNETVILRRETSPGVFVDENLEVNYQLLDFISIPNPSNEVNFTLDNKFIEFYTTTTDSYFRIKLTALVYEFFTGTEITKELFYKVPLYNSRQKVNIGRVVDRLMKRMTQFDEGNELQYRIANVDLNIKEIMRADESEIREINSNGNKYVAGIKPQNYIFNTAILNINSGASRVTNNSFYYFNYLLPFGLHTLEIYKNSELQSSEGLAVGNLDNIFSKKITFENYNPGDVVRYKLVVNGNTLYKDFYVFPNGQYSNHIIWEDDYKLKVAMEMTGNFSIEKEVDNITGSYYNDLLSYIEKVDASKTSTLFINTGWISKADVINIEQMLTNKRAWLYVDGAVIDLVPITKKVTSVDNTRDLIAFDLQFAINYKDNAQGYSF